MIDQRFEILATVFFAIAVVHTLSCSVFQRIAKRWAEGSLQENVFHLLGEVEVAIGLWALLFVFTSAGVVGWLQVMTYLEGLSFSEPLFVFVVMTVAATRPVLRLARVFILSMARLLPMQNAVSVMFCCLVFGPLLGSFITEPAAIAVTAILLRDFYFSAPEFSKKLKYMVLGVLLVNISIGGVLTHFAAPPVLMVAGTWKWTTGFMFAHFGWRAVIAVFVNAAILCVYWSKFANHSKFILRDDETKGERPIPFWLTATHLIFLAGIVLAAHHAIIFMAVGCLFLGVANVTGEYQDKIKVREGLLIAFFLAGLVVFGGLQRWWLSPLIASLQAPSLFLGATLLTAVTDNAALTYLGAQIPELPETLRYALVAGAVSGGGLTVIANAPNPIAFALLQPHFDDQAISAGRLFVAALWPTLIAIICFWFL